MTLTVCHPSCLQAIRSFTGRWIFADNCFLTKQRVQEALAGPQTSPLCSTEEFQRIVEDSRDEFSAWVDANLADSSPIDQLLTPLTRNPFHEFLAHVVWLRIARDAMLAGQEDLLVATRSTGLLRVLRQLAAELDLDCNVIGRRHFLATNLVRKARALTKNAYEAAQAVCRIVIARKILGQAYVDRLKSVDILVDTYLFQDDVSPQGKVKHRYFPGLMDWYRARGHQPAYLPFLFRVPVGRLVSLYRGYWSAEYLFLPVELFLRLGDVRDAVLRCLGAAMRPVKLVRPRAFDVDVTRLAESNAWQMALDGLHPILFERSPALFVQAGIRPRWLLDWFENQPIDHANMIGLGRSLPGCRVVALRHYAVIRGFLSLQTTSREVKQGLVPKEHWLGGTAWLGTANKYDAYGQYLVVPSLRYAYIHDLNAPKDEGMDLLVLLTHSLPESLQIMAMVGSQLPRLEREFQRIRIKAHPALKVVSIKRRFESGREQGGRTEKILWESGDMQQALAHARLVISAGTSAALEAVSMGIPVVLVGAQVGIDICPLETVDRRLWRTVYDESQFTRVLDEWFPAHPVTREERLAIGKITMRQCFEPITNQSMEIFALE